VELEEVEPEDILQVQQVQLILEEEVVQVNHHQEPAVRES
jgi:hypothetical protein